MGLFDFLKPKKQEQQSSGEFEFRPQMDAARLPDSLQKSITDQENLVDEAQLEPEKTPRCFHYVTAHQSLPEFVYSDPLAAISLLNGPKSRQFIELILKKTEAHCSDSGNDYRLTIDDIKLRPVKIGPFPSIVFEFPEPEFVSETHMTVMTVMVDLMTLSMQPTEEQARQIEAQYFTLEMAEPHEDGTPRTSIGLWQKSGEHANLGDGPQPTMEAFVQRLEEFIQKTS